MRETFYSLKEIIEISRMVNTDKYWYKIKNQHLLMNEAVYNEMVRQRGRYDRINENLRWRRLLQISLTKHQKGIPFSIQMDIIDITNQIERYCRPFILSKFRMMIRDKYKGISEQKLKSLATGKMEETIKKYSY